jgi:hypothetical protein
MSEPTNPPEPQPEPPQPVPESVSLIVHDSAIGQEANHG